MRKVVTFDNTITAIWRRGLVGAKTDEKSHWRTKTAYYRATNQLLAAGPVRPLSWHTIVDAVLPKGCRSTFYDVTGPHAKHPLVGDFLAAQGLDSNQLALCYRRSNAVDQLIDETKVWSYWPCRQGWLDQYHLGPAPNELALVDSLVSVVAEWARCNPWLATALDHTPPACAVEDLMLVRQGQLPAVRASSTLARAMRSAVGMSADVADGLLDAFRADLGVGQRRVSTPDGLLVGLAEQIYLMSRESQRLAPREAAAVCHQATELMLDAVRALA